MNTSSKTDNPCSRCGKQRRVTKTWIEKVVNAYGGSTVTYSESVCVDEECQKIIMRERAAAASKMELIRKDKEDRKKAKFAIATV